MFAPEGFDLPLPLGVDTHPEPQPPKYLKHQVYDKPDVFSKVDEHAIQVASHDHPSFRDLMWDLVYQYKLDELERSRAIFRWMSSKDMQNIRFQSFMPNSPEEVLLSFKNNRGTFARIFEIMCSYSGIHCVTVSGYAKGVDYLPGDRFSGLPPNHSWNVMHIRGSWQLVDAHWAARYLSSGRNVPENVVYEYDDFYFMMEPQQAVYSHFPEDQRWQLLTHPLTLTQFENLPLTKSQFFKCAIDFLDQHHGVVYTRDGRLRMTLGFWRPGGFTYKLQYLITSAGRSQPESIVANPSDLRDRLPNISEDLRSFLLQETTRDRLNFYFRLPASGVYYLTIYAQELSNLAVGRESTFRAACEYKVVCDCPATDAQPYPTCHDANWGPAWSHVQHYALEPTHSEGVIIVNSKQGWSVADGRNPPPTTVDIGFGKRRPEVNLLAKLHKNDMPDEMLDQYQRVTETARNTHFCITLPEPGEYGLEIYANEPAEGDTYTHMCQYLLQYEAPPGWRPTTPRLTASGSDAGPSPETVQSWRQVAPSGDRFTKSARVPGESGGSLREMFNYELHAPPMGKLPHPYADSQYAESNSKPARANNVRDLGDDFPSPPPQSALAYNNASEYSVHPSRLGTTDRFAMPPPPGPSGISELTENFSDIQIKQSPPGPTSATTSRYQPANVSATPYGTSGSFSGPQPYVPPSGSPGRFVTSASVQPSSGVTFNGAGPFPYNHMSPQGSTTSSGSASRLPYYQQQYDQISSTPGGPTVHDSPGQSYRPDQSTANWSAGPIQREPPKEFALHPLAAETLIEKPRPQELPYNDNSTVPFGSFETFRRVDEHAVSVSQQQQDNFKQLIWQLIYARNITDELEKVRVIFLWLCTKDLHKMNFDNVKPDSPEDILMGIRTGKSTYAQIFYTLCRYAGLHCKLLIGYAKGAEYAPGMHFSGRQGQHSWNAVLVDKVWRLVDCHWAARRLIGKRPSPDNVRYGLDMFYFLANPGQLIYTHFPHDADWQLLRHPITLKEFENLAPVKSAFFKYNLDLVTHRNAVIICTEPEVCVTIAFPPDAERYLSFTFGLSIDNKEGSEEYRGLPLSRYGRQEIDVAEHKSLFYVRPPRPGAYKLLIYAKQHNARKNGSVNDGSFDSLTDIGSENMYGAVCEYRLVANFGPNSSLPPYPPCQSSSYGRNELADNYQVVAMCTYSTVRAVRGCLELPFILGASSTGSFPRLMGKLKSTFLSEDVLARSLLQRSVDGNRRAVLAVFLPEPGEYGLEVYANNPDRDGNSFFVIWQYIIISDSESPVRGLPTIPPAYLGPMPRFEPMGLSTVSHPDPFVHANTGEMCIQLSQSSERPVRIMAQLIHASNDVSEDCSQQVLQQMQDKQIYFVIRFPHLGFFKFQIYALPYSEPGESLPGVYNYLLEATQVHRGRNGQVMCFPQQFAQWKEGCYLHCPLDGVLSPGSVVGNQTADSIPFRLTVPTARAVAVVVGDHWTHLSKVGDRWEGQVPMKEHWGLENQLSVCANYDAIDGNYGTLLEYRLVKR
ncbi:unnamed protein product [Calicophoron daubneyi]|uniref:Transglutaminase-like domain-containing protein n=1 Tax=Calicophoron daubneyi TaxID=300641 RepID=A0AAV2TN37_CALDB